MAQVTIDFGIRGWIYTMHRSNIALLIYSSMTTAKLVSEIRITRTYGGGFHVNPYTLGVTSTVPAMLKLRWRSISFHTLSRLGHKTGAEGEA